MARNLFALFVVVTVASVATEAGVVPGTAIRPDRPGFFFLGSIKKEVRVTVDGITSVTYADYNYWISVNAAGHSEAGQDCRANGDALLQMETAEELELVEEWLQSSDQTASSAWVGAKYQVRNETFTWENGAAILDEMWATGEPRQSKPNSRVVASLVGQIVQLKSQASTQTTRYICEGL